MSSRFSPSAPAQAHLVDLLTDVAGGDEEAFRQVHCLTRDHVERVAVRTLRVHDLAAEVAQDVFLHVWQRAATYDPARGTVQAWLTLHAHRRAVDRVRWYARAAVRDQRAVDEQQTVVDDVADDALRLSDVAELRTALGRITSLQREAVTLTHLQGYTYLQVADLLQVPLGTVKSRVFDGIASLRRLLLPLSA